MIMIFQTRLILMSLRDKGKGIDDKNMNRVLVKNEIF